MLTDELPREFRAEIDSLLGSEAQAFFDEYAKPAHRALRLNTRRGLSAAALQPEWALTGDLCELEAARELAAEFCAEPVPWQRGAHYIAPDSAAGASLMHLLGLYYIQEPSAMAPAAALDVRPGMRVLDLCAAPGGKSGQLAAALRGAGLLVANDPSPQRAAVLASNLERQGFANAVVTCEYPQALAERFAGFFDAVLVDAPCSGEGMFRRDPQAIAEWNAELPEMCHRRQLDILRCARTMLRPGGNMVYSTCTFNRRENEDSVREFLAEHTDMRPREFSVEGLGASSGGMLRLWPHRLRGEGHFVCALQREDSERTETRPVKLPKAKRQPDAERALEALRKIMPLPELTGRLELWGSRLMLLPADMPRLAGLKAPRAGLELCEVGRSHVSPAYALCRALTPTVSDIELDAVTARDIINGAQLSNPARDGWHMLHWRGLPLCFGKAHGGAVNCHYPKGLRQTRIDV